MSIFKINGRPKRNLALLAVKQMYKRRSGAKSIATPPDKSFKAHDIQAALKILFWGIFNDNVLWILDKYPKF